MGLSVIKQYSEQRDVLKYLAKNDGPAGSSIAHALDISPTKGIKILRHLERAGLVYQKGRTKDSRWHLAEPDPAKDKIVELVTDLPGATAVELANYLDLSLVGLRKKINELTYEGRIVTEGQTKGRRLFTPDLYRQKQIALTLLETGPMSIQELQDAGFEREEALLHIRKLSRAGVVGSVGTNGDTLYFVGNIATEREHKLLEISRKVRDYIEQHDGCTAIMISRDLNTSLDTTRQIVNKYIGEGEVIAEGRNKGRRLYSASRYDIIKGLRFFALPFKDDSELSKPSLERVKVVSPRQSNILEKEDAMYVFIQENEGCHIREIVKNLGISDSTATRTIQNLECQGKIKTDGSTTAKRIFTKDRYDIERGMRFLEELNPTQNYEEKRTVLKSSDSLQSNNTANGIASLPKSFKDESEITSVHHTDDVLAQKKRYRRVSANDYVFDKYRPVHMSSSRDVSLLEHTPPLEKITSASALTKNPGIRRSYEETKSLVECYFLENDGVPGERAQEVLGSRSNVARAIKELLAQKRLISEGLLSARKIYHADRYDIAKGIDFFQEEFENYVPSARKQTVQPPEEEKPAKQSVKGGRPFSKKDLVLSYIVENEGVRVGQVSEGIPIHYKNAKKNVAALRNEGKIVSLGNDRAQQLVPTERKEEFIGIKFLEEIYPTESEESILDLVEEEIFVHIPVQDVSTTPKYLRPNVKKYGESQQDIQQKIWRLVQQKEGISGKAILSSIEGDKDVVAYVLRSMVADKELVKRTAKGKARYFTEVERNENDKVFLIGIHQTVYRAIRYAEEKRNESHISQQYETLDCKPMTVSRDKSAHRAAVRVLSSALSPEWEDIRSRPPIHEGKIEGIRGIHSVLYKAYELVKGHSPDDVPEYEKIECTPSDEGATKAKHRSAIKWLNEQITEEVKKKPVPLLNAPVIQKASL